MSRKRRTYPQAIRAAIEAGCSNPPGVSRYHGEKHWQAVAVIGLYIASTEKTMRGQGEVDLNFITTFAQLHDIERRNDDKDINHGLRAGLMFQRLVERGQLIGWDESQPRVHAMHYALRHHNDSAHKRSHHQNVNVGICWDADRLCLTRVGEVIDSRYLTTHTARSRAAQWFASRVCEAHANKGSAGLAGDWEAILSYPGSIAQWVA